MCHHWWNIFKKRSTGDSWGHGGFLVLASLNRAFNKCKACRGEYKYHQSSEREQFRYGFEANQTRRLLQDHKSALDKLANSITKWLAVDWKRLLVVEDEGLENVLQMHVIQCFSCHADTIYRQYCWGTKSPKKAFQLLFCSFWARDVFCLFVFSTMNAFLRVSNIHTCLLFYSVII